MPDPRVLVVEDDLELSAQICAHLRVIGCGLICGTEGHHLAEDLPPDLQRAARLHGLRLRFDGAEGGGLRVRLRGLLLAAGA